MERASRDTADLRLRDMVARLQDTPIRLVSAATTLTAADAVVVVDVAGGGVTVTLPDAATHRGQHLWIKKDGAANTLTVAAAGSDTVAGGATDAWTTDGECRHYVSGVVAAPRTWGWISVGSAGGAGTPGADGAQGPAGPPGVDGAEGPEGPIGPPGATGESGAPGATGATGATGPQGPAGLDGADGADGPIGPEGPQGATGATGATGPQGPAGPPGADGAEGPEGPQGAPGPQGPAGADGVGGGGSATTVEVDLGSPAKWQGRFTITDAAITAAKKVMCWQAPGPYTGKGTRADEAEAQPVSVVAVNPAAGSATVYWQTPPMVVTSHSGMVGGQPASAIIPGNKDPQAIVGGINRRLGKVRGNVKFTYFVLS